MHKTTQWTNTEYPSFEGLKAYVLPGAFYSSAVAYMAEMGFKKADTVADADVVVFIGGTDVDPGLYYQETLKQTQRPDIQRDKKEQDVYEFCTMHDIPMFGICRGAQFLHVMNGGELWQHVEGHAGPNHLIYDIENDVTVEVTSMHHQMLQMNSTIDLIAHSHDQITHSYHDANASVYIADMDDDSIPIEVEAGTYYDTKCFFVQGHPEVGDRLYRTWTAHQLRKFLTDCETPVRIH